MPILSQQKQSQAPDFPNVRPSLDLRFALAKKLDPRITFTRGSSGTYFGPDGIMRTAGVNEPRFDHDPITGQSLGLLVEESRTNLFSRGDIEGTVGSTPTGAVVPYTSQGQSVVVSTDVFLGPNGQSAKHTKGVQQNDSNTGYFTTGAVLTIGQIYCASIWLYIPSSQAKNFAGKTITFQAENAPSVTTTTAIFDTTLIGIWQRAFCVFTASATSTGIIPRTNANAGSFFYTDCWQLELGAFPTSYMPASGGSQFTRSADVPTMTGTNFSSWYNSSEGTLFVASRVNALGGSGFPGIAYVDDGTINNSMGFYVNDAGSDNIGAEAYISGRVQYGLFSSSATTANKLNKVISSYSINNFSAAFDTRSQIQRDTSGSIPTVNRLRIGALRGGLFPLNGTISRLTYYPIQLTNQQLINLCS